MVAPYKALIYRIAPGRKSGPVYARIVRRILNREAQKEARDAAA